jgi:NAD(P)-dependent dehydrogenase (short-subunit alcohol dehydrogenase family)
MTTTIRGAKALVTGAGRGLGQVFSETLIARGAATVYGAARDPGQITTSAVTPVRLDITSPAQVAAAAKRCSEVDLLINNAGIMSFTPLLSAPDTEAAEDAMRTNYFGTLAMCRAFAPVLGANGGGTLVNILSVVSWFAMPLNSSYGASKSAEWALTNAARVELRQQATLVVGVFASFIDTDMAANVDQPKISPRSVVDQTLDAIEAGREEVLTDDHTRFIKAALPNDLSAIYPAQQDLWDATHPHTRS